MKILELQLRRARLCFITSTVLFVVSCLLEGPSWDRLTAFGGTETFKILARLSGVLAWSLMCTAYGLRRKAL